MVLEQAYRTESIWTYRTLSYMPRKLKTSGDLLLKM